MSFFTCGTCDAPHSKKELKHHFFISKDCVSDKLAVCMLCKEELTGDDYLDHLQCSNTPIYSLPQPQEESDEDLPMEVDDETGKEQLWNKQVSRALKKASNINSLKNYAAKLKGCEVPKKSRKFNKYLRKELKLEDAMKRQKLWDLILIEGILEKKRMQEKRKEEEEKQGEEDETGSGEDENQSDDEEFGSQTDDDEEERETDDDEEEKQTDDEEEEDEVSEEEEVYVKKDKKQKVLKEREVKLSKKELKELRKKERKRVQQRRGGDEENDNGAKKKQKAKKRKRNDEEEEEEEIVPKKSKKRKLQKLKNGDKEVETVKNIEEPEISTEVTPSHFDWEATVIGVLKAAKSDEGVSEKRLQKKVISEYHTQMAASKKPPEKLEAKFKKTIRNKNLFKLYKDKVKLIH